MATISIIVPAAGCGARAGFSSNKILEPLLGRPLLSWTLGALVSAPWKAIGLELSELILVARAEEFPLVEAARTGPAQKIPLAMIEGGATRQQSVWNGVQAARGEFVLVHDAARPCVTGDIVSRTVLAAREHGAALAALQSSDTVKRSRPYEGALVGETLPRQEIWLAQTPQVFKRRILLDAMAAAIRDDWEGTDCASVVERVGGEVALVEGSHENLKVTYARDMDRAAEILAKRV